MSFAIFHDTYSKKIAYDIDHAILLSVKATLHAQVTIRTHVNDHLLVTIRLFRRVEKACMTLSKKQNTATEQ